MTPTEYINNTEVTDHTYEGYQAVAERCREIPELLHYGLGVASEAGELLDAIKKHIAYGKELDIVNVKEEVSDIFWYCARICKLYGWTFEEVMDLNINKLKARYGEKFSQHAALNRDLTNERKVLEGK